MKELNEKEAEQVIGGANSEIIGAGHVDGKDGQPGFLADAYGSGYTIRPKRYYELKDIAGALRDGKAAAVPPLREGQQRRLSREIDK